MLNKKENNIAPTLTTRPDCLAVVVPKQTRGGLPIKNKTKKGYLIAEIGDGIDISSRMQYHRGTVQKGMSLTLTTQCTVGVLVKDERG